MAESRTRLVQLRTRSNSPKITENDDDTELMSECLLDKQTPKSYRRRILRLQWVDNAQEADKPVLATILHQRRHDRKRPWLDSLSHFELKELADGQDIRLHLSPIETWRLYEALRRAYKVCDVDGRPNGERSYTFDGDEPRDDDAVDLPASVAANEASLLTSEPQPTRVPVPREEALTALAEQHGEAFWELVDLMSDNLPQRIALQRVQQLRAEALAEFEEHLKAGDWSEPKWQSYFERNTWIFGFGLSYRFIHIVEAQAQMRPPTFHRDDGQRGDFLLATGAAVRFTVIVDIKHPQASLINHTPYRNGVYHITPEVAGGVAQVQSYCRNWETQLAREMRTVEELHPQHIYTCQPKGFLVIGHADELKGNREEATAFESFRRNLQNPEIVTFDELLERARYIVGEGSL